MFKSERLPKPWQEEEQLERFSCCLQHSCISYCRTLLVPFSVGCKCGACGKERISQHAQHRATLMQTGEQITEQDWLLTLTAHCTTLQQNRKKSKGFCSFPTSVIIQEDLFFPLNGSNPPQQPQTSRCPGSPPQNLLDVPQQGQLYLMGKCCCCLLLSLTIPGWHPLQNRSQQAPCMLGIHTSNSATHFSYSSRAVGCELTGPLRTDLDPVIPACAGSGGSNKGFSGSVWRSNDEFPIASFWSVHLPRAVRIDVISLWLTAAYEAFLFIHTLWKMHLLC